MKRNVYFVQANPVYGEIDKSVYIPYATGCIAAYAWSDKTVKENYTLGRFIYKRENLDAALASLVDPSFVCFSCSVWNMEYNKAFAKKLKSLYPDCIVLFGGHHVSSDAENLLEFSFVDVLVHGGGEEAFQDILIHLTDNRSFNDIQNISFRTPDGTAVSTEKKISFMANYPSPYLEGYFDEILKDNIKFSAILETNRGCPNSCAFCDWGDLKVSVRLFPLEKIMQELIWLADKKIDYLYCGDANFGLFDRDEEITDMIINLKKTKGYPQKFRVSFTKNRSRFVQKISKKLNDNNIDKFHTLSFQSLSPIVLENIGRKNLNLKHFKNLMVLYNQSGISAVSELIIGLPGETYDSFCAGICTLLECGQHSSITVYPCELLPNSQMGAEDFILHYGIKAIKTPYFQIHCEITESSNEIQEYSEFVVATSSLTQDEWVRTVLFSCYIQALHNLGLNRVISLYLRYEKDISYLNYYSDLIKYFENTPGTLVNRVYNKVKSLAQGVVDGKNAWVWESENFGNITWGFEEIIFLELASNLSAFFKEIKPFLEIYQIEKNIFENLIYYQKNIIKQPNRMNVELELEYDFYKYFENIYKGEYAPLNTLKNTLSIFDDKPVETWYDFAREIVWFGRTEEATLYTGSKYDVVVKS
ncbi:MAG: radical SAM protein [Eubacteriales bacterium]